MKKFLNNINLDISHNIKQKLGGFAYHIGLFLYLELLLHIMVYKSVSVRIFYPIFFALVSGSIMFILCSIFPKKVNAIFGVISTFIFVIYYEVQLVYHCIFGSFMPISQMTMGADAVTNFTAQVFHAIFTNFLLVLLIFLPVPASIILFYKKIVKNERITLIQIPVFAIITLALSGITMVTLHTFNTSNSSAYAILVNSNTSTEACVKNLGLAVTTLQETKGLINSAKNNITFYTTTLNTLNNDTQPQNKQDIDFNALNEQTQDSKLNLINSYLTSVSPTAKNKYTGVARDFNLITICAESFNPRLISKELTPTLYKLSNSGFVFNNFYNSFANTTTNGEYSFVMGLMPNMSRTKVSSSFDDSIGNYLPYCLGNIYKEMGLEAKAYHNYYASFYDRLITHANMGYDFKAIDAGLNIQVNWPSSDLDMIKASVDEYINSDKPFHTYYMTFSGHYQYDWNNAMSAKNKKAVEHLEYSDPVKAYIACNLELEYALTYLMDSLKKAGKADKTVIVLTGDHYPYGLAEEQFNELAGEQVDTEFEKYKNSFICYVPGMERVDIDSYCATPDILPTVLNIMGIDYDSRLLAGKDVLSDAPHIAVLSDQSYITDTFKYNASTSVAVTHDGKEVEPFVVQDYCNYVANMFSLSNAILSTNYYSHVFDKQSSHESSAYIHYDDISSVFVESAVSFMVKHGYMVPDKENVFGTKRVEDVSQFIEIIYNMAQKPAVTPVENQPDSMTWALENKILEDPNILDQQLTNGVASSIVYNYVDLVSGIGQDTEFDKINEICAQYPDIPREQIIKMKWCHDKNIISSSKNKTPYDKFFNKTNRGNMALFLQRMYFLSQNK